MKMMMGLMTNAMKSIVPTKSSRSLPYWVKIARPLLTTFVNTRPMMPNGARLMIQRTMVETASDTLLRKTFVESAPSFFIATPKRQPHIRMPM